MSQQINQLSLSGRLMVIAYLIQSKIKEDWYDVKELSFAMMAWVMLLTKID